MADSTWADEIVIDPSILNIAATTRASSAATKLKKYEVVEVLSRAFSIGASRADATQDPISGLVTWLTPLPEPKKTNERYNILAKIVEQLPEDFWYATKQVANDGTESWSIPAFNKLNILPYLSNLQTNPNAPEVDKEALASTIESVKKIVGSTVEMVEQTKGFQPGSPEVDAAITEAESSTILPDVQTAANESGNLTPSATGAFVFDALLAEDMSPQEFAQTYGQTSLLDLADKQLTFGLSGLLSGGKLGDDASTDVYQAVRWFYNLDSNQVAALQEDLARAGYFDQVGQSYAQVGDASDAATRQAWDLFLVDVVRQGAEATPETVMNQRIQTYLQNRAPAQGYVFSDQATLRSMGNDFAQAFAGRNLDYVELQSFYKMVREWERQAALGVTFAQENEQIDVRARAEEYFDAELRVEQAKNIASKWGNFGEGLS